MYLADPLTPFQFIISWEVTLKDSSHSWFIEVNGYSRIIMELFARMRYQGTYTLQG